MVINCSVDVVSRLSRIESEVLKGLPPSSPHWIIRGARQSGLSTNVTHRVVHLFQEGFGPPLPSPSHILYPPTTPGGRTPFCFRASHFRSL
ncbi:hypothetical protein CEXT_332521 [Caerostris extrusa]|uniref:Uncharacterized protein n=1 Tax=Caerostris extrusa TaxID=172846 RepID=A0AAV4QYS0_CAEEX|nr:hypothetical protein CEXT_332521 [Caerostris extrusa]